MDTIVRADVADAGCWIDGHWGIYGSARLIAIAQGRGMRLSEDDLRFVDAWHNAISSINGDDVTEAMWSIADDTETWLNDHCAPDGYMFGWHDGEFFLSSDEWWQTEQQ